MCGFLFTKHGTTEVPHNAARISTFYDLIFHYIVQQIILTFSLAFICSYADDICCPFTCELQWMVKGTLGAISVNMHTFCPLHSLCWEIALNIPLMRSLSGQHHILWGSSPPSRPPVPQAKLTFLHSAGCTHGLPQWPYRQTLTVCDFSNSSFDFTSSIIT